MRRAFGRVAVAGALAVAGLRSGSARAAALDLVRGGRATAAIITPRDPLPAVAAAARELQYHVREATGATLPIVAEGSAVNEQGRVYLGACQATGRAGIRGSRLPPNAFTIRLEGNSLFLAGHDSPGEPFWIQHDNRTRVGTLFAVYEFLDRHLGVRWLWPGKLGEVIPKRADIRVTRWNQTHVPRLVHSRWRDGGLYAAGTAGWSSPEARAQYLQDQGIWLRRQRFALGVSMDIHHAFTGYWERFGQTHPEFFNLLPDGTRRPDPHYWGGDPALVSMCVSQPALWRQIVADWQTSRTAQEPYLDASENDTDGRCTCPGCLSWDGSPASRLAAARKAFADGDMAWTRFLGPLSDRYARFYLAVQKEAERLDPRATVMGLAYANYTEPPRRVRLNSRILIAVVPPVAFPWTEEKRWEFRRQWDGWRRTGARLMLRPNYTLDGHNLPIFVARKLGHDLSHALRNGLIATDFDSLLGQWATQGPNLYVLGRLHARPEASAEQVLEEYYAGFGPARSAVRAYFAHWERLSDSVTDRALEEAARARGTDQADWARFHRVAPALFTPGVMAEGRRLLAEAARAAQADPAARQRVAFLEKGLRNAELTLATQEAFERYRRTGDIRGYREAIEALDSFRASVERENVANMAALAWLEAQTWDRALLSLLKQPGEPLPGPWRIGWDPENRGTDAGWFADDFDDSRWPLVGVNGPWERQEVGRQWRQEHGEDYNGVAWYRTRFTVGQGDPGRRFRLVFGAVDEAATVWVNGRLVLNRPFPYQGNVNSWQEAFDVDVTPVVRMDRPNTLAVRVEDNAGAGGIWRPVWLVASEPPAAPEANRVRNGSFEEAANPWATQTQCGDLTYAVDAEQAHSGRGSARITCTALGPPEVQAQYHTRAWGRWYQAPITVRAGRPHRLRLWVRTSANFTGRAAIWVTVGGEVGTVEAKVLNTEGLWREVIVDGIVPASDHVGLYLNLMDGTGTVWFDEVELVETPR